MIVFSKGGFVSVPPCAAAWLLRIPVITHECDFSPGLATRINAKCAQHIFVSYEKTISFFPRHLHSKIICTGNPVRMRFYNADKDAGKAFSGYTGSKPVLFIQGGSLGALQINMLVEHCIAFLAEHFFVIHQTGQQHRLHGEKIQTYLKNTHPDLAAYYSFFPFIGNEMPDVLACADIVISRAGANSIWEAAATGKVLILLPLEKGNSRGDQIENAAFFEKNGAAIVLDSAHADAETLIKQLTYLLHEPDAFTAMAQASKALAKDPPAVYIAHLLQQRIQK